MAGRRARADYSPGELDWVVRNRQVRSRAVPVGRCVGDIGRSARERRAIREAIAGAVDDEFRCLCGLGVIDGSRVEIHVEGAAACDLLRRRWLTPLREILKQRCRAFGARRLVFRVGPTGDRFAPDRQQRSADDRQ